MIKLNNINKTFDDLTILKDFNLSIDEDKIVCFLGASGCGKTTLLNIISGTLEYDRGSIEGIDSNVSYIFQDTRLLPWATIENNIKFVLKSNKNINVDQLTKKYIDIVKLSKFSDYYPKQLSGGMKQRVSIARAFAYGSQILLMDEPFQGLDYDLKIELINAFLELWEEDNRTVIFVTHDLDEALLLSDKIYILDGRPVKIKKEIEISIPKRERIKQKDKLNVYRKMLTTIK
ncbi:ABC transporter ATP-binding protein [Vallitalea sp.]|jgi:NitT/TauT family transport system ATP-binding protein|uniref:ABC transporter ATP-binding protein n=1 Tax=Vallitalea sp. TaxID=1882829 RepID=UPI0025DBEEEC|nr:ABC transporter ATP-binding protein [Vallitalea sp.]MCT4686956.1 ABC transporter ATP-binding protein [Vallitalea sp.]